MRVADMEKKGEKKCGVGGGGPRDNTKARASFLLFFLTV